MIVRILAVECHSSSSRVVERGRWFIDVIPKPDCNQGSAVGDADVEGVGF